MKPDMSSRLSSRRAHASVSVQALTAEKLTQINSGPTHGAASASSISSLWSLAQLPQRLIPPLALGAFLLAGSADAQQAMQHCGPRAKVIERLATKYGETRRSMGLGSKNTVMEVFASDESGSWTITVTLTNGITCLVASGQAFEATADRLPPQL